MGKSLKAKLSFDYALIALLCVFSISILANFFLEKQFSNYIIKNQYQKNHDIVNSISNGFQSESKWNIGVIQNVGIDAMQRGMIVSVKDKSGNTIWDATEYNNGVCKSMINHMSQNMIKRFPNFKGGYIEEGYPIVKNSVKIATVKIGYYGPFFYTDNDLFFLKALNTIIIAVGIFSLLFAVILGILMAARLSKPILNVINTTGKISNGKYEVRINKNSDIKEINELTSAINSLAESLQRHEMLRKRLTADIAHELRTPITTLQSHMEAMIDGIWEPSIERIKSCHEEILRLGHLVGDLKQLTDYESENISLNKSDFNVSSLVGNILMNFQGEFRNKDIKLETWLDEDIIISADKDKIGQVIVNIISNAIKYTNEGGLIKVTVRSSGNDAEIVIWDNGIGISKADLPYIFERFFRADKSRNRKTGGAGIGLAITKAIVEAHNGRIYALSEENKGTEFHVLLPKNGA